MFDEHYLAGETDMAANTPSGGELKQLTELFRKYGAADPESWASSQINEGIPQLAIFCFAKAAWEGVVSESDVAWIDHEIEWSARHRNAPCSQAGEALMQMLAKGVSREIITDLVRVMQYSTLFHVCSLLDGACETGLPVNNWSLFQVDDNDKPLACIHGVHENVLGLDPTGREMRPRCSLGTIDGFGDIGSDALSADVFRGYDAEEADDPQP